MQRHTSGDVCFFEVICRFVDGHALLEPVLGSLDSLWAIRKRSIAIKQPLQSAILLAN